MVTNGIKRLLIILLFAGSNYMFLFANAKIIFWNYNKDISFEELCSWKLDEARKRLEIGLEIPLSEFTYYLWDEQILYMDKKIYDNNNYEEKFTQIEKNSDRGSLYFSVVINNSIVFNGLNRIRPESPAKKPYSDSKYPRITIMYVREDNVLFRFTYVPIIVHMSIWEIHEKIPSVGDVELLFVEEIYEYFISKGKIKRGRYDINKLYNTGILIKIS
jgi:hypothetical protein